jgi:hypothetical protein
MLQPRAQARGSKDKQYRILYSPRRGRHDKASGVTVDEKMNSLLFFLALAEGGMIKPRA